MTDERKLETNDGKEKISDDRKINRNEERKRQRQTDRQTEREREREREREKERERERECITAMLARDCAALMWA